MSTPRGNRLLKIADRWIGIPLVALLGAARRRPRGELPRAPRIGVMKTAAIGDTLLLAGLTADVRRAFPDATLVMIAGPDNRRVAELLPGGIDEVIEVSARRPVDAIRAMRRARLDLLVDFGSWPRFDAVLAALSAAGRRVGFRTAGQHRHFAYDVTVEHSAGHHERENYARLVAAIGVRVETEPHLDLGEPRGLDARAAAGPYVVFHPWSAGYKREVKQWSVARWKELAAACRARGWTVLVSGSRQDAEQSARLVDVLTSSGAAAESIAGLYDLAALAHVMREARAVVAVNTGIMHLAALAGAPVVSLEGPTPPHRWGPIGPRVVAVTSTLTGSGYLNLGFEYRGQREDCMDGITVDAVLRAIDELGSRGADGTRARGDER